MNQKRVPIVFLTEILFIFVKRLHGDATDKTQYVVALNLGFVSHFGLTTAQTAKYLSQHKALDLYDHHTSIFSLLNQMSGIYLPIAGEWEEHYDYVVSRFKHQP